MLKDNYHNNLSEYIHKNCSKEFSLIDADLIQWKSSKGVLRFIEYKHVSEGFHSKTGRKVLEVMASAFNISNLTSSTKMYVYLVRSDDLYKGAIVENLNTKKTKVMDEVEFKDWLEFRVTEDKQTTLKDKIVPALESIKEELDSVKRLFEIDEKVADKT